MHVPLFTAMLTSVLLSAPASATGGCGFEQKQTGLFATCDQEQKDVEVIATGILTFEQLSQQPNYQDNFDAYQADEALVAKLSALNIPTELVVLVGTWCPDCHRETPRLAKILAQVNNPNIKTTYIGIDRQRTDPEGLSAQYEFSRIPTILVLQQQKELGRIVEEPSSETLEQDLVNILGLN